VAQQQLCGALSTRGQIRTEQSFDTVGDRFVGEGVLGVEVKHQGVAAVDRFAWTERRDLEENMSSEFSANKHLAEGNPITKIADISTAPKRTGSGDSQKLDR